MSEPERMERTKLESINIINALRRGTVPGSGLERIAVGLDVEEGVIGKQLDYVSQGGGDTKFIRGDYGSGKTFLVARALEMARNKGFVTSHVVISSTSPLYKLKAIYQQVCANLRTQEEEHAIKTVVDNWLFAIEERIIVVGGTGIENAALEAATEREIESALTGISEMNSALAAALRTYYRANNTGDFQLAQAALGWIAAEPNIGRDFKQKAGIRGDIDDTVALLFLRGLVVVMQGAGYSGLAIAIDEMETTQALPKNQRDKGTRRSSTSLTPLTGGICHAVTSCSPVHRHCLTAPAGSGPYLPSMTGSASFRPTRIKIPANPRSSSQNLTHQSSSRSR